MPVADGFPKVEGRCPACGLSSLFLGSGGYVTCGNLPCPDPSAASNAIAYQRVDEVIALCRANAETWTSREGGSLRGAPSHSGADLATAWQALGLRLVRVNDPSPRASEQGQEQER